MLSFSGLSTPEGLESRRPNASIRLRLGIATVLTVCVRAKTTCRCQRSRPVVTPPSALAISLTLER